MQRHAPEQCSLYVILKYNFVVLIRTKRKRAEMLLVIERCQLQRPKQHAKQSGRPSAPSGSCARGYRPPQMMI